MTDDRNPRLKTYEIDTDTLMINLREGDATRIIEGIPEGAELYAAGFDNRAQSFYLIVEHESFNSVAPDDAIPTGALELEDISDHRLLDAEPQEQ